MGFYSTTGGAVKALDIADVYGAGFESGFAGSAEVAPRIYYAIVPFVRRAVRLRANAVSGVPITLQRGEKDISARPEFAALMDSLQSLIWRTEFALNLSLYGAYWRRSTNAAGLNPTPEWLLPQACYPNITAERGLTTIRYVRPWGVERAGIVEQLPLDEVVIFWHPSLERAVWPGTPPGATAGAASAALVNRDRYVAQYFKQGATKSTLLSVPKTTSEDNRNKLKTWWRQVVAGIANAWASNVISEEVKPVIIGDSLKDTESDALTLQYRQDIAAAFEVPESMLLSNSANYATAKEERISFYEETVFPALDLILSAVNKQWLRDAYDAELVAHPEQTEARQDAQMQQAQAITDLVGKPVLSIDEGRAWLGMEPMVEEDGAPDEEAEERAMQQEEDAEAVKALGYDSAGLLVAHRMMRQTTRERQASERKAVRARQVEDRREAKDAAMRLRLVQRQRAELAILAQRHAGERQVLYTAQRAERGRVRVLV